jgi:hypothetical protein
MSSRIKEVHPDYDSLLKAVMKCWMAGETPPYMRTVTPSAMMDGSYPVARLSHRDNKILSYGHYILAFRDTVSGLILTPTDESKHNSSTTARQQENVNSWMRSSGLEYEQGISDPWKVSVESVYALMREDVTVIANSLADSRHFPAVAEWAHAREMMRAVERFTLLPSFPSLVAPLNPTVMRLIKGAPEDQLKRYRTRPFIRDLKRLTLKKLSASRRRTEIHFRSSIEDIVQHQFEELTQDLIKNFAQP